MNISVLTVRLVCVAIFFGLGWCTGRELRLPRRTIALLAIFAAAAAAASIAFLAISVRPASVAISIDHQNAARTVEGNLLRVSGTVQPASARVTLVVRAMSDKRWWVQSLVKAERTPGDIGVWHLDAVLGTEREGRGEAFEVIALASGESRLLDLLTGRDLVKGQVSTNVPLWNHSQPVVVWRSK